MDVTCERCGTEYDFDETLLSGRGTSVKCTNCGHVFKVYPKAHADADRSTSSWRLKLQDGSIDTIDSLRELQQRIGSGELTPATEIARGDEGWKALGSIPELETFFQAAGVQMPSRGIASPVPPSPVPSAPSDPTSKDSSLPPRRRPRQPTLLGVMPVEKAIAQEGVAEAGPVTGPAAGSVTEPGPAPGPATESYESPYATGDTAPAPIVPSTPPPAEIEDAEFEERPRDAARPSARPSAPPPAYYDDDDDDIPDLPGRSGSPLRWLLLILVVGGLALLVPQWERVTRLLGIGVDATLVEKGISEGDAGLAEGHPQAYAAAIDAYRRSIDAGADGDPKVLVKLSNAYALAAQAQRDADATGASAASLAAEALTTAQSAADIEPQNLSAKLAKADALRLTGKYAEARKALDEVRSMSAERTAEFFRVDARLSAAEVDGGLENGLRSANRAAELAPEEVRYLLLQARAKRAAGDDPGARVSVEAILVEYPEHPVATKLLAELQAAEVVEAGTEAGTETGAGAGAETGAETGAAAEAVTETVAKPAKATARRRPARKRRTRTKPAYDEYDQLAEAAGDDAFVDGRPPVRDYGWYMRQGRAELAGGNYSRARAFFDSALEAKPGSAEAMDALGQVSMRIEDFDSALRYFRVAARRGHDDGYFNLGKTFERMGRTEEAVSAYYTYVKRRPTGAHAAAAKSAIKTLQPNAMLPPEPEPEAEPEPQPEPSAEAEPSPAEEPAQEPEPAAP